MAASSENNYDICQIVYENIEDLIFIFNKDFKCEYSSTKTNLEDLDVSIENKKLIQFIHPQDIDILIKLLKSTLNLGYGTAEIRFKLGHAIYNWYEIKSKRFLDNSKESKVILFFREITKFKKLEQEFESSQTIFNELTESLPEIRYWKFLQSKEGIAAYQKTREMLELVIDNIPQLIYWKDVNLTYLGCNINFATLTGMSDPLKIIGKKDEDLMWVKHDLTKIQESERKVMVSNIAEYHNIESFTLYNGDQIWFEVNRIPLHNINNEVVGILSTYEDITIRKIAVQKLKESEEKYRSILENIKEGYFEVDLKGNFTFFNDALCDLTGSLSNELIGSNYEEFLDTKNKKKIFEDFNEVFRTGISNNNVRYLFKKKSGEEAICESSIYLRYDSKGNKIGFSGLVRDITEKFHLEDKIKESAEKYQGILENIKEGYFEVDLKGNFTFFNDALCELQGLSRSELLGLNFKNFVDEENKNRIFEVYSKVYETEIPISDFQFQFTKKDGEQVICESSVYLRYDLNGNKIGFSGLARDITDKFRLEQKIKESEEKYRHLFESSPYAICLMEVDGTILDCNSTMNTLLSAYKKKDLEGKKFTEVISIVKRPEFLIYVLKERWAKFLEGDKLGPLEFELTRVDGKKFWLDIQSSLVKVEDKMLMQAIIQDITEKKIAEQNLKQSQKELRMLNRQLEQKVLERTLELRKSEQQYRTTIDSLGDSLHVVDRDLRIILINQEIKKWLSELNIETDILGKKISEIFPFLPPKIYDEYQQVFKTGKTLITTETTMLPKVDVITETRKIPIFTDGKVAQIITIIRDITEKKKVEQELNKRTEELIESERKLREQNIELRKLDQIKNDFITMAAHELKTPLISISGYTDYILLRYKDILNPEVIEDLIIVQRNVKRLEILMDQLLEVMKIDEGKLQLQKERINISKIINRCLDDLSYLINEKNLEIILNFDYDIMINVDPTRILLVFTNLISNAIKFTHDYGWIKISARKEEDKYNFEIKDNGIGLTEDELRRLFKKFEKVKLPIASESANIKDTGTGLGLYISKGIVEAHGGEIKANSEGLNKGTTFFFSLPL
ncbi:MAG: PAS domain S-box protein [Promethearchaeota archaeon]